VRVLQIHNLYREPGGEEVTASTNAALLREGGHEVDRLLVRNPDRPLTAMRLLAVAPWNVAQSHTVRRRVLHSRPDVAHVHNTWFALSPSILHALYAQRVPIVMSLHNYRLMCANASLFRDGRVCTDCVGTHPGWGVVHSCYHDSAVASSAAAATIALNRARGTWDLVDRFDVPTEFVKRMFVSAGLHADRLSVNPRAVTDPGRRRQPPSASQTVLYAGKLASHKGIRLLLDGWREASASVPHLELVVVGDGPLHSELTNEAFDRVRFLGWADSESVQAMMLSARALVVPSRWYEVVGRVALEAFAAGLPVLASDIGGLGEVVGELGPECLVASDDRDAWAAALTQLGDDASVDAVGARARELFERRYTNEICLHRLLELYESVTPAKTT
jgi:glycosyltransferase involved in cell wall biosynthesis